MENQRIAVKVGLFVLIGLVLFAGALILFSKGASLVHGAYELRLHASNVGGLKQRAGVLLAGVQVGTVSDIQLADDGKSVTILLKIYKRYKIYDDAKFVIEQAGFLGDQYVAIVPQANQGQILANGQEVQCQEPFNLQEVARGAAGFIQRIDVIAKKLDDSVNELRRDVLNPETLTNFSVAVGNMRSFSEDALGAVGGINQLVATNGTQVTLAVSNLYRMSGEMQGPLAASLKNIETSTDILTNLMAQVQSGKGLAGTVLQNQEVATNMQAIVNNLATASSNLNHLGLWHFLWHKEAEPRKPAVKK
jgi:phospholipid/cholesterol/gamma-HCH transport system substrate-binding protein